MATGLSGSFHRREHEVQHNVQRLRKLPDLRFEYSYLQSISPYVHVQRVSEDPIKTQIHVMDSKENMALEDNYETVEAVTDKGDNPAHNLLSHSSQSTEIIHIQWFQVLWVTMRDQVISPLIQGAVWALVSYWLTPFSGQLGSRMGTFVREYIPTKEGLGISWIRGWAKDIGLSGTSHVSKK